MRSDGPFEEREEMSLHAAATERIGEDLRSLFGDMVSPLIGQTYWIEFGKTQVMCRIHPRGDRDPVLEVRRYILIGEVKANAKVLRHLLGENNRLLLGAYGVDTDGDIFISHAVTCRSCDRETIKLSVMSMVGASQDAEAWLRAHGRKKRRKDK